jgi:hypothetical protein
MGRHKFTPEDCRKGRQAQAQAEVPAVCPHCGRSLAGYSFNRYLGHLGLHGLADNHFNGDVAAAQKRLRENALALAEQDASWSNGAWGRYRPITTE